MAQRTAGIFCTSRAFGGLEINTLRLAQWMRNEGWEMPVLFVDNTPLQREAVNASVSATPFIARNIFGRLSQLHKWVRAESLQVIIIPYNKDLKLAALYKRFINPSIRLVYQQHMQVGVPKRDAIHTMRYGMLDAWISPLAYLKEETLQKTRVPESKIHIIPFGIEPRPLMENTLSIEAARELFDVPTTPLIIGTLGRLDPKKGQDTVVRALHILRTKHEIDVHVLLVGDATLNEGDAYSCELSKVIADNDLSPYVHLRPYQPDIVPFFRAIDVFAMPSHGETYGMVTLEAMAAGVPVIGGDKDGTRELLEEGRLGYLFEVNNAEDFVRAFLIMQKDASLVDRLEHARAAIQSRFTEEGMCRQLSNLLTSMVH